MANNKRNSRSAEIISSYWICCLPGSVFLYIPIINEDMKCLGLDTNRLSYSTWSILVIFFFPFNKRRCLLGMCKPSTCDSHNNVLRNITLLYGANASKYGSTNKCWKQFLSILYRWWIYNKDQLYYSRGGTA